MADIINIRKLEANLWESADLLRVGSKLTSSQYCIYEYLLSKGAHVGVAEVEDDGVDFHKRKNEIHAELAALNKEANELTSEIMKSWEGIE